MVSGGVRAYNEGPGAVPQAGSCPWSVGQGQSPPEADTHCFSSDASIGRPKSPHMCAACCQLPFELCCCLMGNRNSKSGYFIIHRVRKKKVPLYFCL